MGDEGRRNALGVGIMKTLMKTSCSMAGLVLLAMAVGSPSARAAPSVCDADAGNLVQNCGFEGSTYATGVNSNIPTGWTAVGNWSTGYNGWSRPDIPGPTRKRMEISILRD
jgi:hypothetical protein